MRRNASWRLRHWERWSSTTTRSVPDRIRVPRRRWMRRFSSSLNADDLMIDRVSPALVLERLACWPPGPEVGPKSHLNSRAGTTGPRRSRRSRLESAAMLNETTRMSALAAKPWVMAARPRTLWAAVAPVLVGSGASVGDGVFRLDAFLVTLLCALALQVAANFANDASDARRGADPETRIGPTRVVAAGLLPARRVWWGVAVMFGIAALCGFYIAAITTWAVLVVGALAPAATVIYTGGPSPYGYRGMGEVSVFLFFGLVATVGSRFAHDGTLPLESWLLAVPVGFTASAILVANNIRDIDTDAEVGKRTMAVILGRDRARILFVALVAGAFGLVAIWSILGLAPRWTAVALLAAPLAVPLIRTVRSASDGPALIRVLEGTARLHLLVGVGLALGAAIG